MFEIHHEQALQHLFLFSSAACLCICPDNVYLLMHLLKFKRPQCNRFFTASISPGNQSCHPSCQRRRIYHRGRSCAVWCQVIPDFGYFSAAMSARSIYLPDVTAEHWGVLVGDSGATGRYFQTLTCAEPSIVWSSSGGRKSVHVRHIRLCAQGWSVHSGWCPGLVNVWLDCPCPVKTFSQHHVELCRRISSSIQEQWDTWTLNQVLT